MSINLAMATLASEIEKLKDEAELSVIVRGQAKNQNGRLTEFGKKLIKICLEAQLPQSVVARLLGISTAAVNQHAAKVGVRKMDIKTKSAVIRWDSDEVDVTVIFQNPLEEVCEGIPAYKGKAKIGQFEGTNYVMIISDYELTSLCGRVMSYICDNRLATAITAIVTISDEEPVDGFVESVNLPFEGIGQGSFPLVLICLKKMLLPV